MHLNIGWKRAKNYCGTLEFWEQFHKNLARFWALNIPIAIATELKGSLEYLIILSLMTAFSGEMAALHGTRTEIRQEKANKDKLKDH